MTCVRSGHGPAVSAVAGGGGCYSIWWVSYWDRSQRREIRESSGSRSRRVALTLLAQREAEAAARPLPVPDARRRKARAADGTRRGGRGAHRHGLTALRRVIQSLGPRPLDQALDPASPVGQALAEWRRDLTNNLGGPEAITTAQAQIVEVAVRTRLLLDSVDAWLLQQGRVINGRTRACFPVVVQRQRLADGLVRHLETLGLDRRARGPDLARAIPYPMTARIPTPWVGARGQLPRTCRHLIAPGRRECGGAGRREAPGILGDSRGDGGWRARLGPRGPPARPSGGMPCPPGARVRGEGTWVPGRGLQRADIGRLAILARAQGPAPRP